MIMLVTWRELKWQWQLNRHSAIAVDSLAKLTWRRVVLPQAWPLGHTGTACRLATEGQAQQA